MQKRRESCFTGSIGELVSAPYNPRVISQSAMAGLQTSLSEFGDIAGITWNKRTGNLVTGHQRLEALKQQYGDDLRVEDGAIIAPNGDVFSINVVDMSLEKEKAANIAANSAYLQGEFTADVASLLEDVKVELPAFEELRFDLLLSEREVPDFQPVGVEEQGRLDTRKSVECPECGHEFIPNY